MKIRIYAILPETEEGNMDLISEVVVLGKSNVDRLVDAVTLLHPDWRELNIECITAEDKQ